MSQDFYSISPLKQTLLVKSTYEEGEDAPPLTYAKTKRMKRRAWQFRPMDDFQRLDTSSIILP